MVKLFQEDISLICRFFDHLKFKHGTKLEVGGYRKHHLTEKIEWLRPSVLAFRSFFLKLIPWDDPWMEESLTTHSDEELAVLFKETGNSKYFSALAYRYEKNIFRKCKSYVKDDDSAEDLCQEVLIKLFLQIKNYRSQAKFHTWIFAIIHNICIDHLRKNKKNVRSVITEKLTDELGEIIEEEEEISKELSEKVLGELLEEISPEQKMLLLMKYKEKHHIKDIQVTLGLSESAVKMRLKRAKEKIKRLYRKHK